MTLFHLNISITRIFTNRCLLFDSKKEMKDSHHKAVFQQGHLSFLFSYFLILIIFYSTTYTLNSIHKNIFSFAAPYCNYSCYKKILCDANDQAGR